MAKDVKFSLDYSFKKTLEAEEELREYLKTGDNSHLIYCINNLGAAIRELVEIIEDLQRRIDGFEYDIDELEIRIEKIEDKL